MIMLLHFSLGDRARHCLERKKEKKKERKREKERKEGRKKKRKILVF